MSSRSRTDLVTALIQGHFPLEPLCAELRTYPWDLDEPLVTLRSTHVADILGRFLTGELSAASVTAWAEALELRDDIGFDEAEQSAVGEAVFLLANPDVNGELTRERAEAMLRQIARREQPNER